MLGLADVTTRPMAMRGLRVGGWMGAALCRRPAGSSPLPTLGTPGAPPARGSHPDGRSVGRPAAGAALYFVRSALDPGSRPVDPAVHAILVLQIENAVAIDAIMMV